MINLINKESKVYKISKDKSNVSPFILTSPHSGTKYSKEFLNNSNRDFEDFKIVEDSFVNLLFDNSTQYGIAKLDSLISRVVIDLNRNVTDLDKTIIKGNLKNSNFSLSSYGRAGFGLIHNKTQSGNDIYKNKLSMRDVNYRINFFYYPWHNYLKKLIEESYVSFGFAFLLDCHSMPSITKSQNNNDFDFIIGNRFNSSCDNKIGNFIENYLSNKGYNVGFNMPYSGGYITKNYGNKKNNIHALQLEISKDLYMNEKNFKRNKNFKKLKKDLDKLICDLSLFLKDSYLFKNVAE